MSGFPANESLLYLPEAAVRSICAEIDSVAVIREVFRLHGTGQTILPGEAYLAWISSRGERLRSLNMPAFVGGPFSAAGTKIINANPKNPSRRLPRASGLTTLFDSDSGRVVCIMEGTHISALRTAAVSFLSVELLAGAPVRRMAVIGAGPIGAMHGQTGIRRLSSLERLVLFDIDSCIAKVLAANLRASLPRRIDVGVAASAEGAVREADLLITATTVTAGYIPFAWLNRGALVINVSLDDLLPDVFRSADLVFVDDWGLVSQDSHRLLGKMFREGIIAAPGDGTPTQRARRIDGEIAGLVLGHHSGRRTPEEIVVVNPFGLGIEDVALASCVYQIAVAKGLGTPLPR